LEEETMNKAELVEAIAKLISQTKADTERTLDAFIDVVSKNIKKKEGVKLVGFGTFAVTNRKARVGRNPQTGEEIQIPARRVPVFRPGKELKDNVR
jgi:DNA-binding protein HU-beta